MSIHSSFKTADTMKRHRSVLSRLERIKLLAQKGSLSLQDSSFLGLPKVKHLKIRMKKEKAAAAAGTAEAAAGGTAPAAGAGTAAGPAAKPQAGGKAPAGGKAAPAKAGAAPSKPEAAGPPKK